MKSKTRMKEANLASRNDPSNHILLNPLGTGAASNTRITAGSPTNTRYLHVRRS
jgi:hypothetical protein